MNNLQTPSSHWRKQKGKLKLMFPELNDDDFKYDYGMKEAMMANLQLKLGISRSELNELITDCNMKKLQVKYNRKPNAF
jgi:uncharacterized protein YjbJ (UPF0337 family)